MADRSVAQLKNKFRFTVPSETFRAIVAVIIAFMLLSTFWGCGKKAPPKPPEGRQQPPVVTNLAGDVENGILILNWTVPAPTEQTPLLAAGFNVLVYKQSLGEPCPNCPPNYKQVGRMRVLGNLEVAAGSQPMRFRYPVEKGYQYTVVVIAVADDGTPGSESNTLRIEY